MIRRMAVLAALLAALVGCGELPLPSQLPQTRMPAETSATAPAVRVVDYTATRPPTVTGVWRASCHARGALPDARCTPGSVAPRTKAQVCMPGFSATVRPTSRNSEAAKTIAMRAYGIALARRTTTELDHLVPLSLGGSNDSTNLWPEASDIPNGGFRNTKDGVEDRVHAAVCRAGSTLALDAAQAAFAHDWTTALAVLGVR